MSPGVEEKALDSGLTSFAVEGLLAGMMAKTSRGLYVRN